jgi:hypothetical protein
VEEGIALRKGPFARVTSTVKPARTTLSSRRQTRRGAIILLLVCASLLPASARSETDALAVDLALVLAVDVSYSMGVDEQAVQRQGYVAAFRGPEVLAAVHAGPHGRIAVTYVEWGGIAVQVVPWTLIDGRAAADRFATVLAHQPVRRLPFTAIARALAFSRGLLLGNRYRGTRRVVDISGDGPDNSGVPVVLARNRLVAEGIVIDGLPIMLHGSRPADPTFPPDLDAYYRNCVAGGPGAFIMKVTAPQDFAEAILRKLLREISGQGVSQARSILEPTLAGFATPVDFDCLSYEAGAVGSP